MVIVGSILNEDELATPPPSYLGTYVIIHDDQLPWIMGTLCVCCMVYRVHCHKQTADVAAVVVRVPAAYLGS